MEALLMVVVVAACCCASYTDVAQFKVRNKLTFPLAAGGLLYHLCTGGSSGLWLSTAGLGLGLALLLLPYALGGLGAGDVKFFAAIGAWLGPSPLLDILVIGCLATGVFAAVVIVRQRGIGGIFATLHENLIQLATWFQVGHAALGLCPVQDVTSEAERRRRFVPFSAMLSIGVIVTVVRQLVADPTQLLR